MLVSVGKVLNIIGGIFFLILTWIFVSIAAINTTKDLVFIFAAGVAIVSFIISLLCFRDAFKVKAFRDG